MADRGILFSAPMVRALLDGRKTQTRRLLKPQPPEGLDGGFLHVEGDARPRVTHGRVILKDKFPFATGDRLWVCEAFSFGTRPYPDMLYRADGGNYDLKWSSPIHMPRWASRLTLTVTDVRVQRLQEISQEDAEAEGVQCDMSPRSFVEHYHTLWDSLHDKPGERWEDNPWICAISFSARKGNIDG